VFTQMLPHTRLPGCPPQAPDQVFQANLVDWGRDTWDNSSCKATVGQAARMSKVGIASEVGIPTKVLG
jgi:hypothetical protein